MSSIGRPRPSITRPSSAAPVGTSQPAALADDRHPRPQVVGRVVGHEIRQPVLEPDHLGQHRRPALRHDAHLIADRRLEGAGEHPVQLFSRPPMWYSGVSVMLAVHASAGQGRAWARLRSRSSRIWVSWRGRSDRRHGRPPLHPALGPAEGGVGDQFRVAGRRAAAVAPSSRCLQQFQVMRVQPHAHHLVVVHLAGHVADHRLDRELVGRHPLVQQLGGDGEGQFDGRLLPLAAGGRCAAASTRPRPPGRRPDVASIAFRSAAS